MFQFEDISFKYFFSAPGRSGKTTEAKGNGNSVRSHEEAWASSCAYHDRAQRGMKQPSIPTETQQPFVFREAGSTDHIASMSLGHFIVVIGNGFIYDYWRKDGPFILCTVMMMVALAFIIGLVRRLNY